LFNHLIAKFFIRAVYQKQNEFQFHTSKHYINHPISIDTKFSSIWTNKSMEFIPADVSSGEIRYWPAVSKLTGTAAI
jgi:hypothetical protein